MEFPSHIETLLKSLARFTPEVSAEESAHRLQFKCDAKTVKVMWPMKAGEVFLDFTSHGELLLA